MKNTQLQIFKMAVSAAVPLAGIAIGLGLSVALMDMKPQAQLPSPRMMASIIDVYPPAEGVKRPAQPADPYMVSLLQH